MPTRRTPPGPKDFSTCFDDFAGLSEGHIARTSGGYLTSWHGQYSSRVSRPDTIRTARDARQAYLTPSINSAMYRASEHYASGSAEPAVIGLGQPGLMFVYRLILFFPPRAKSDS